MFENRLIDQSANMNICQYMDKGVICELQDKYILHWNYRGLSQLPVEILYHGIHVQEMYLKCNELKQLPAWLDRLDCLRNLYLFGNRISELPKTIGKMPSLSVLELENNCLSELTPSIGDLKNLRILNLQYNYIEKIPKEISKLKSLIRLNLKGNKLTEVCEDMCSLNSLKELILDENKISVLPNKIVYLPNLSYLSLDGNKLKYLPFVPFINRPMISIARNRFLNYLSYDLGSSMTSHSNILINGDHWHFNCVGCFKITASEFCSNILDIPSFKTSIVLPPLLKVYDETNKFVPSLFELSLRTTFDLIDIQNCLSQGEIEALPLKIMSLLNSGPNAVCQNCKTPIFTESILWVFPRQMFNISCESPECFLAVMFFCTQSCAVKYREQQVFVRQYNERISIELINWSTS